MRNAMSHRTQDSAGLKPVPETWPAPGNPMAVARQLLLQRKLGDHFTLHHWRGEWHEWAGPHYVTREPAHVAAWIYKTLEDAVYKKVAPTKAGAKADAKADANEDAEEEPKLVAWLPNRSKIGDVLDALAKIVHVPDDAEQPAWLDGVAAPFAGARLISMSNGLLDPISRQTDNHSPAYFNAISLPFKYEADVPAPTEWLTFLDQVLPGDTEAIAALQEWFGYILSGRTDLQKIMLLVGKPRAGKGTVLRVLRALIGAANHCSPTMGDLAGQFGLQPLIGKSLAVIPDARITSRTDTGPVLERILSVSGEDAVSVNRKNAAFWTGKLPTRFMMAANEAPRFPDSAGAFVSRLIVITFEQSFIGMEDEGLSERIISNEMPGILSWALDGPTRLAGAGSRFSRVSSSVEEIEDMHRAASPHWTSKHSLAESISRAMAQKARSRPLFPNSISSTRIRTSPWPVHSKRVPWWPCLTGGTQYGRVPILSALADCAQRLRNALSVRNSIWTAWPVANAFCR